MDQDPDDAPLNLLKDSTAAFLGQILSDALHVGPSAENPIHCLFLKLINSFIYLFLAVLCLHCCVRAFSSCGKRGILFVVVRRLLTAVASLVVEHGL